MDKKKLIVFALLLFPTIMVMATHQRAGEITYRHISGLTYEFTIITYTYTPSPADRPELEVLWGDGTSDIVARNSKVNLGNDISRNIYTTEHTFPAAGSYTISMEDPDRNAGIVNIPNSVNIPFFLETILIINPFLGSNSSPQLLNPPIDNGCLNITYYHNPGAYDPDGDSLSYSLIPCRGYNGETIPGYTYPSASNRIHIDEVTGELTWDAPMMVGEYNIAILIKEWRNGILIGSVVRDMQITIVACDNVPPEIITIDDTCVVAGETLHFEVTATDANSTNVNLTATGSPFQISAPATFTAVSGAPPVTTDFTWHTQCQHVRLAPYSVVFKAEDNGPQVNLSKYKTVNITIIAPRPENLFAEALGNYIYLSWSPSICDNAAGYLIYKRKGSNPFLPDYCQTGMPPDKGYELIGKTEAHSDTTFTDDGSIMPLYHGNEYCYRIVAYFSDHAESYVSEEACAFLNSDVPMLTHVDIETTDSINGEIEVRWTQPSEFDTLQYPGPHYEYQIYRAHSRNMNYELIGTTSSLDDTTYFDHSLNTSALVYYYRVELWAQAGDTMVQAGVSDPASSVFLKIDALDRKLRLSWEEQVPWNNLQYTVYRYNPELLQFDSLTTTEAHTFVDEGLDNNREYCYYVKSEGAYFIPDTLSPLWNRSQIVCEIPYDDMPPEIPAQIKFTTDCETVEIEWSFSGDSSFQDVHSYYIYYKPTHNAPYSLIDSFPNDGSSCYPFPCRRTVHYPGVITGCFAMALIDSNQNLSALSGETCFDYDECADYKLPNVFTPNGDGINDLFVPFPYNNVAKISMVIYDRWGRLVFKTENPDINWDGTDHLSRRPCPEGTYYYSCEVFIPTLTGETTVPMHGTITLIR